MNQIAPSQFANAWRRDGKVGLPRISSCKDRLTIKAILLDLDGTIIPTYKSLAALQYLQDQLEMHDGWAAAVVADCGFDSLLDDPAGARRAAIHCARKCGLTVTSIVLRRMSTMQEQSYFAYEGLRDLLKRSRKAGIFLGIYTNTSCEGAIHRLRASLIAPDSFDAIWARNTVGGLGQLRNHTNLIPYDYRKPDDAPLRELAAISGARPHEVLFVGDSVNDLDVAYRDKAHPGAIFCLQERGAGDIDDRLSAFNARLRPGQPPLGLRSMNGSIDRYGIEREIIRLSNGFVDLLNLIDNGQITLLAPDQAPIVQQSRLVPGRRFFTYAPQVAMAEASL